MREVYGKYGTAKVFTDDVDDKSIMQIQELVDNPYADGQVIRMMPDVHAGEGCVIGTTMTIDDKVAPSLVGVDIGCGMNTTFFRDEIDFANLDAVIREHIPFGFNRREVPLDIVGKSRIEELRCYDDVDVEGGGKLSLGTLGGGNHFIEVNKSEKIGDYALVIHSGSRKLGLDVCQHYVRKAKELYQKENNGRKASIYWCEDQMMEDYLHDMAIMQEFATMNREAMRDIILTYMDLRKTVTFETIHNYIDMDKMILRKGAISAEQNELVLIPINMRDGSIVAHGRGNKDWNFSAPHGAGRIYGRKEAKRKFSLDEFEKSMNGIYSTCIREDTLDEAPFVYKSIDSILCNISDTVDIEEVIKPVYNFKA